MFCFLGIFHCYMEFASLKDQPGSDVTIRDLGLQTDFAVYLQIRQTWLAFSTDQHTF